MIDSHGDHLLGCGQGPLRIKRHNALRDIIWQALLLDNSLTTREQRCDDSLSRPGDIVHPDFLLGKAAFFDVSVRNSFQPNFLTRSAFKAGAAGEAGEIEKDAHYRSSVESMGALFYPLVVESFGLWTPHSLLLLKTIAGRVSIASDIIKNLAFTNFLQQLSVKLWSYNAKMIMSRLHSSNIPPYFDSL